ncbi:MAG: fatty acid desaturase [Pirellulaceae bacterium]|nr:fatty acid desaturase [Pirellulaceae bacterium]
MDEVRAVNQRRVDQPQDYIVTVVTLLLYVGVLFAPFCFSWSGLILCFFLYCFSAMGVTLGYHRLLTHRSFKTYPVVRNVIAFAGASAFMGGPLTWVGIHRLHHAESDQDLDPHTPAHGFLWSHLTYIFRRDPADLEHWRFTKDLSKEPFMVFLERYQLLIFIANLSLLYLIGEAYSPAPFGAGLGWSWVIWGGLLRVVLVYNAAGAVNSFGHVFGYRNFETKDSSRNLWWVAILTFGEGWHNNHHASQRLAAHGRRWFELDPTYWCIRALEMCGLAWNVSRPNPAVEGQADSRT